jgi:hypothetical protein
LEFTGVTATGAQIRQWAQANGFRVEFVLADRSYAQIEHESGKAGIYWLKRLNYDTGATYTNQLFDCENFAAGVEHFATRFGDKDSEHAPAVFVIYAKMAVPFAGVPDSYHALNVAWTDKGIWVFEPQGVDLVAQDLLSWPNVWGITHAFGN